MSKLASESQSRRENVQSGVLLILLVGLAFSIFFHSMLGRFSDPPDPWPASSFLFRVTGRFDDLFNYQSFPNFKEAFWWAIPPVCMVTGRIWAAGTSLWGKYGSTTLFFTLTVSMIFAFFHALSGRDWKNLTQISRTLSLLAFCYPLIFVLDRGNQAGIVVGIIGLAVWSFERRHYYLAAILIALATDLKFTPAVFACLFVVYGLWRPLLACTAVSLAMSIGAVFYLKSVYPAYSLTLLKIGMKDYFHEYALGNAGISWSISLWSFFRASLILCLKTTDIQAMILPWVRPYNAFVGVFTLGTFSIVLCTRISMLTRLTLICAWISLAPHVIADYYLMILLIPLAMCFHTREDPAPPVLIPLMIALLFIPKAYFWLAGSEVSGLTIAVLINPLLLSALYATAIGRAVQEIRNSRSEPWFGFLRWPMT